MFSPLNDPQVEQWFQQLTSALKFLPAEEQAKMELEVRQHLEALAAANIEAGSSPQEAAKLALTQFGNPAKFGRRMTQEWQRQRGWVSEEGTFALYIVGMYAVSVVGIRAACWLIPNLYHSLTGIDISASTSTLTYELLGVPIAMGVAIGRKYPYHALTGTLYTVSFTSFLPFFTAALALPVQNLAGALAGWGTVIGYAAGLLAGSFLLTYGSAYLASVTRRGWYKPTLADFKLTPPKRWQISR